MGWVDLLPPGTGYLGYAGLGLPQDSPTDGIFYVYGGGYSFPPSHRESPTEVATWRG